MNRTESEPVTTFGPDHELTDDQSTINLPRLLELFRSGVAELSPILKTLLAADTFAEIQRVATLMRKTSASRILYGRKRFMTLRRLIITRY